MAITYQVGHLTAPDAADPEVEYLDHGSELVAIAFQRKGLLMRAGAVA